MTLNPLTLIDFYKADHRRQYPKGTELVYSNLTPRSSRVDGTDEVVFFGLQYFVQEYLIRQWNDGFFQQPKAQVLARYQRRMDTALGPGAIDVAHIGALHDLGYLPLEIKALPEGSVVPLKVPMLTMRNTHPDFFWLTNYLETLISCVLWKPCTSATTARTYRRVFDQYADETVGNRDFVGWQGHDFSMRGMSGVEDAVLSGAGHLLSFTGTDSVPAIDFLETYYGANADTELVGGSVPATEHSVMCMGLKDSEIDTFERLITTVYPAGVVSIVSDTWDFWRVITEFLPQLKSQILAREGKVVIRPDSGDPVKIICGDPDAEPGSPAHKGAIECLWETFGGIRTERGYKLLDSHIGLIYGDSITTERQLRILEQLKQKGFASFNVVLGIGSYTYEYVTRDTFGFAVKATYGEVNGEARAIFKDPKTDSGTKRSARGLLRVVEENGRLVLHDQCTWDEEATGLLQPVFRDGQLLRTQTLADIRGRLATQP
ncbi:putative nicotinate phosphoribosyltransferase [Fibrella aestuarina BUZ 2]|uniref:Nicotinamide phosphoribosyltransferase n=1 Tax=Fibrella aestuarina BUZ 2 TaxID=1166018 RepID=I0KH31_9BACT|nr:nicotinate phosphoribosyltransferase [Fibrella aestuarina]CCH03434.1 putative nicotinate phosphoribosyltransferase [Fibrella aestuarina BUZ 2]